jgi:hypothetical protein
MFQNQEELLFVPTPTVILKLIHNGDSFFLSFFPIFNRHMVDYYQHKEYDLDGESHARPIISKEAYDRLVETMGTQYEVGGSLVVNGETMDIDKYVDGSKGSISLPVSKFEHHTHPGKCESKADCALGVPSVNDMENILNRSTKGNFCHFVIAHEGTYAVKVRESYREHYNLNSEDKERALKRVRKELSKLQTEFSGSSMSYPRFQRLWMREINSSTSPFRVDFFSFNVGPVLPKPEE